MDYQPICDNHFPSAAFNIRQQVRDPVASAE
jgi:hypothetical protein